MLTFIEFLKITIFIEAIVMIVAGITHLTAYFIVRDKNNLLTVSSYIFIFSIVLVITTICNYILIPLLDWWMG